jgi:hypothetical protein
MIQTLDTRTVTPASGSPEPPREAPRPPVGKAGTSHAVLPTETHSDIGPYRVILRCSSQRDA